MPKPPARTLTLRVVTMLACTLTLLASGMWWLREAGILVPIAGTRTTQTILELIVWTQVAAAVCLILVPWFWNGSPWPRLTVWRWQSVVLPVLPWLSLVLGPTFAGPTFAPQILLITAVVTGVALALARLQSATVPGDGPTTRTVVARVIALGVALVSILLSIGGMILGVTFSIPVDVVRSADDGREVIVERHATLLDNSYEVRWVEDGRIYRRG